MDTFLITIIVGAIGAAFGNILSHLFIRKAIEDGHLGKQIKLKLERLKLRFERQFPEFAEWHSRFGMPNPEVLEENVEQAYQYHEEKLAWEARNRRPFR